MRLSCSCGFRQPQPISDAARFAEDMCLPSVRFHFSNVATDDVVRLPNWSASMW